MLPYNRLEFTSIDRIKQAAPSQEIAAAAAFERDPYCDYVFHQAMMSVSFGPSSPRKSRELTKNLAAVDGRWIADTADRHPASYRLSSTSDLFHVATSQERRASTSRKISKNTIAAAMLARYARPGCA